MILGDAASLAIGTLSRVRVRAPRVVDRRVAAVAMLLAPLVGAVLGLVIGAAGQLLVDHTSVGPLLAAALVVGALAYVTRAIHLDGLADTVDALGSGRPAAEALEIARRSDVGPFGVVAVVVVLLTDVAAVAQALSAGVGPLLLVVALGSARLMLALACLRGVPAARPDGLGAAVAGSVPSWAFVTATVVWALACVTAASLSADWVEPVRAVAVVVAAIVGALLVATVVVRIAVRRLGGVTGDVLGCVVELATAAALVILVAGL